MRSSPTEIINKVLEALMKIQGEETLPTAEMSLILEYVIARYRLLKGMNWIADANGLIEEGRRHSIVTPP